MKMKKIKMKHLLMTALVTLPLTLVGCGSSSSSSASGGGDFDGDNDSLNATITVQAETDWVPYYDDAIARVKETYPNATINIIKTGGFDVIEIIEATDVTNPDVPDVFSIPLDRLYSLSQNEVLAAIDAKGIADEVGGFSNFEGGLGGAFNMDGDYLGMPLNIETLIVFANTANAEANGVDLTGTIEFTDLGAEDMLSVVHDAWFGITFTNTANIEHLTKDANGVLSSDLTKDFSELTQEQQDLFEMFFQYWKAHSELGTDLWDMGAAWGYLDSSFDTGGNTSLRLEGPWATPSLANLTNNGEHLAVLPISSVTVNGNQLNHWQGGWGISVNARVEEDAQKMLLAEALITELVRPENAVELFEVSGKILPNADPTIFENSDLEQAYKDVISATLESYDEAVSRPLFIEWGQVWNTWQNALLSWSSTKPTNAEEAYLQVQASFKAMMSNF